MGGPSLLCLLLSFKEAERKFLIPESSLYDSWHILSSSTTIIRLYAGNQVFNLSRNSPSLLCLLVSLKEAKRTFLTPGRSLEIRDILCHFLQH
jgi:hypothetical protein